MDLEYQLLHSNMLADIEKCLQPQSLPSSMPAATGREGNDTEKERAERCFWLANDYWVNLKEGVRRKKFKDEKEEMDFFRNVKPKFTSYIEYFVILSEALHFVPKEEKDQIDYWNNEMMRYERFFGRNHDFIHYYESASYQMDEVYFKRANSEQFLMFRPVAYDSDAEFCSVQDALVRTYLANKMYWEYAKKRLALLMQNSNK